MWTSDEHRALGSNIVKTAIVNVMTLCRRVCSHLTRSSIAVDVPVDLRTHNTYVTSGLVCSVKSLPHLSGSSCRQLKVPVIPAWVITSAAQSLCYTCLVHVIRTKSLQYLYNTRQRELPPIPYDPCQRYIWLAANNTYVSDLR